MYISMYIHTCLNSVYTHIFALGTLLEWNYVATNTYEETPRIAVPQCKIFWQIWTIMYVQA